VSAALSLTSAPSLGMPRRKNAISLTALIDVVFILLMFFMLTSTFSKEQSIELKKSQALSASSNAAIPQLLLAYEDGSFAYFNTSLTKLGSLAELNTLASPEQVVNLLPAAELRVQDIVSLLEQLRSAGFMHVSLGEPLPEASKRDE
jgi:biopolymer transport protein ExbD